MSYLTAMIAQARSGRLVAALLAGFCLAAAGGCAHPATHSAQTGLHLGMVTDVGGLGDRSFNDSANRGLQQAKRELGARVEVLQSRSAADYQPNLTNFASQNFDQIYAIGFLMAKDVAEVAGRFPDRQFAIVDAVVDRPNVTSVTFKEEDGSFLAGALAASVSTTKTIAFLGGMDIPLLRKFEAGFAAGAREVDPAIKLLVKYAGSFDDVAAGKELAGVLFDQGADIIYVAAGKAGLGAIDLVKTKARAFLIGVDSNQDDLAKGKILTSMVKHVDTAVFKLAQAAAGHASKGGHLELGLSEGAVGLTDFAFTKAVVTPPIQARLRAIRAAIVGGKIVPPATREELASFKPVKL